MARPAVLVVDPDSSRRRELSHGLTGFGYEVIPAVDAEQGELFAGELGPGIVVAPENLPPKADFGAALFQPTEEELPLVAPLAEPV